MLKNVNELIFVKNKIAIIPNIWKARYIFRSNNFTVQRMEQNASNIHILTIVVIII